MALAAPIRSLYVLNMTMSATPFDSEAPEGSGRAIIRRNPDNPQEVEMVEARWGSDPRFSGGTSYRFIRAEDQRFPDRRCLVPVSEILLHDGGKSYRATLDGGNFFYLAAIWEAPLGDWPLSFRIITVDANPDIGRYQARHGAMIPRGRVMHWLDHMIDASALLVKPPARTFLVTEIDPKPVQTALPL